MDDTRCSKNLSVLFNIALLGLINSFSYKKYIYIIRNVCNVVVRNPKMNPS